MSLLLFRLMTLECQCVKWNLFLNDVPVIIRITHSELRTAADRTNLNFVIFIVANN